MIEPLDRCESFGEVESLIRCAGDYVQPSRDFRPRVLEASRLENSERRARRRIGRIALFAALLGLFTFSGIEQLETPETFRRLTLVASASQVLSMQDASGGDSSWRLVEAYSELRRRQAEMLRL